MCVVNALQTELEFYKLNGSGSYINLKYVMIDKKLSQTQKRKYLINSKHNHKNL